MTEDEMNRKMEFLVEWQAQFAADIERLKERQDRLQGQQDRLQGQQDRFQDQLEGMSAGQYRFQHQLETIASVVNTALETSTKTAEVVTTLATTLSGAQTETQRQIARVAILLETHVREGHPPDASRS